MKQRNYTRQSRKQWQTHIDQQDRSDLSIQDYCQQHGLSPSNFYNWRKKLKGSNSTPVVSKSPWVALSPEPAISLGVTEPGRLHEIALTLPGDIQLTLRMR